jgi:acyl-[acyl-carrier-protein] desaturase
VVDNGSTDGSGALAAELGARVVHEPRRGFGAACFAGLLAADENLHMVFYRDMLSAALLLRPSDAVRAIAAEVIGFEMPGAGITNFASKAVQIAQAGIYDLRTHQDDVVWPLLRQWGFFEVEDLDAEAEQARTQVSEYLTALDKMAIHYDERRAKRQARREAVLAG